MIHVPLPLVLRHSSSFILIHSATYVLPALPELLFVCEEKPAVASIRFSRNCFIIPTLPCLTGSAPSLPHGPGKVITHSLGVSFVPIRACSPAVRSSMLHDDALSLLFLLNPAARDPLSLSRPFPLACPLQVFKAIPSLWKILSCEDSINICMNEKKTHYRLHGASPPRTSDNLQEKSI